MIEARDDTQAKVIPKNAARFCLDCEAIHDQAQSLCPACGGRLSWPVAKWIDRREATE